MSNTTEPYQKWQRPHFRTAKQLPLTIIDQMSVCIEESLYTQAFSLFTSAVTSGMTTSRPAQIPPPRFTALAATIAVHPSLTSRTRSEDKHDTALCAIQYLHTLTRVVSPKDAGLHNAFCFTRITDQRAQRASLRRSSAVEEQVESLNCIYANQESVWNKAEDFWKFVGWCFNCSAISSHRWYYLKLLLTVIIEALENDMMDVISKNLAADLSEKDFDQTLIVRYLNTASSSRSNRHLVFRAIFADGSTKAMQEFGPLWNNETALPSSGVVQQRKRRKVDVEHDQYGDYDDDSDQDVRPAAKSPTLDTQTKTSSLGNATAISLRRRLFAVLVQLCLVHPTAFLEMDELFELYSEVLRGLSLEEYEKLITSLASNIGQDLHITLCQMLLRPLLDSPASMHKKNHLSQADFEQYFVKYAANTTTASDNAKVSILIEELLRLLWKTERLGYTETLRQSTEEGIALRSGKAREDSKESDSDGQDHLKRSGDRISALLDMLQEKQTALP